jgi:uncharacterized delta-60 repeat protein
MQRNREALMKYKYGFSVALRGGVAALCLLLRPDRLMAEPDIAVEQTAGAPLASGDLVTFPDRLVGGTTTLALTISNTGTNSLDSLSVGITGPEAAQFGITGAPLDDLEPGGHQVLGVTFTPAALAGASATLSIGSNDPDENPFLIYLAGTGVLPGRPDHTFQPQVNGTAVYAVAVQPDGKLIIGGNFTSINGQPRNYIARLLPDGSLESLDTFNPGTGASAQVNCIALQPDGKIVIGGNFTSFNGQSRNRIARLNPDGTLEGTETFNIGTGPNGFVYAVVVQPDGKIILGGSFNNVNGQSRSRIARLTSGGAVEAPSEFNIGAGANNVVRALAIDTAGRILVGGQFTQFNNQSRGRIARLGVIGALESTATFNPGTGAAPANSMVRAFAIQPDGKILAAGDFTTFNGLSRSGIVRLQTNGAVESNATFNPGIGASASVNSLCLQADGRILIAGDFTSYSGAATPRVALLNPDGTQVSESLFTVGGGAGDIVWDITQTADGAILVAGEFDDFDGSPPARLVRLLNPAAADSLDITVTNRVRWLRGGTAPELHSATFDLSVNGGSSWTPLNTPSRISGGWESTGLSLPRTGLIRTRGRTSPGLGTSGAGMLETISEFNFTPDAEIVGTNPVVIVFADGASLALGTNLLAGVTGNVTRLLLRNVGSGELTSITAALSGPDAAEFTLNASTLPAALAPGAEASFTITATPASTHTGVRAATLQVTSDDPDEPVYDLHLAAHAISPTRDSDGDGMNDWGEFRLDAFGFNYQTNQAALVASLLDNAEAAGLYTLADLQAIQVDAPVVASEPGTGFFVLTIGIQQADSPDGPYVPFPMVDPQTLINPEGKLEFRFSLPGDGNVFRLEAR